MLMTISKSYRLLVFPVLTPQVDSIVCVFVYKYRQLRKGEFLSTLLVFAMVTISPLLRLGPRRRESSTR
jgi:hypothetical protein